MDEASQKLRSLPESLRALAAQLDAKDLQVLVASCEQLQRERCVDDTRPGQPHACSPLAPLRREDAAAFLAAVQARRAAACEPLSSRCVLRAADFNQGSQPSPHAGPGSTVHEHFTDEREKHTLAAWQAQKQRWERLRARLSARTGNAVSDLVLERGPSERLRMEAVQLLELEAPIEDRYGAAAWACSLRDNFQLSIPMGHPLFSGLTAMQSLSGRTQLMSAVRAEPLGASESGVEQFMVVQGQGLEKLLRAKCTRAVSLHEALMAMEQVDPEVAQRIRAADGAQHESAFPPPPPPPPAAAVAAGPRMECSPPMLSFRGRLLPEAAGSAASLTLYNSGSTALYYAWHLCDSTSEDAGQPPAFAPLEHQGPRPGCLLPGESRTHWFRFTPSRTGTAREIWALRTSPQLRGESLAVMLEGVARQGKRSALSEEELEHLGGALPEAAVDAKAEARRRKLQEAGDAFNARLQEAEKLLAGGRSSRVSVNTAPCV